MAENNTQNESKNISRGADANMPFGPIAGAGGIMNDVTRFMSASEDKTDKAVHYEGELGTFDYNPTQWTLEQKQNYTEDVESSSDMVLKYIGEETDGNNIEIPDGLKSLDWSFAGTDIKGVPEIPDSVESTVSTFADCSELQDITNAQEYMNNTPVKDDHDDSYNDTYDVSGDTEESIQNANGVSQQAEGQKVYVINGHGNDTDTPEIYSEQQIDTMRREVANADTWKDMVDTYKDVADMDEITESIHENENLTTYKTRYYALTDGTYAEANTHQSVEGIASEQTYDADSSNYEIISDSEDDAQSMYEQGEHIVTFDNGENWSEYDNQLNVGSKTEGFDERYHRSEDEINHMKEILAEVDEIDGKGNYEDNLQALQDGSYVEKAEQVASEKGEELVPEKDEEDIAGENGYLSADTMTQVLRDTMFSSAWIKNWTKNGCTDAGKALQDAYESTFVNTETDFEDDDEIYKEPTGMDAREGASGIRDISGAGLQGQELMGAASLDQVDTDKSETTSASEQRETRTKELEGVAEEIEDTETDWEYEAE